MITPELKDLILSSFVELGMDIITNTRTDCADYDIDRGTYEAIIKYLDDEGYLSISTRTLNGDVYFKIEVKAHDLVRLGGFVVQDEILKGNIQKLGLEIDLLCKELAPNQLDKVKKIAAIGNSILSALNLMS